MSLEVKAGGGWALLGSMPVASWRGLRPTLTALTRSTLRTVFCCAERPSSLTVPGPGTFRILAR
jgi:hypothetical protein